MNISVLLIWLNSCPYLSGEPVLFSFLPSYSGWSLTIPKQELKTDILGTARHVLTLTLTRRITVQNETDRLALLEEAGAVADWCAAHPMPGTRVRMEGLPTLTARSPSGTEDASITFFVAEL